jgi:hypothetical protein
MVSSRAIPSTLVLQHVVIQTFTFTIPVAISMCHNNIFATVLISALPSSFPGCERRL